MAISRNSIRVFFVTFVLCMVLSSPAFSQTNTRSEKPEIYLGLSGDYQRIDGASTSQLDIFLGYKRWQKNKFHFGFQGDISWFKQQELYDLGIEVGMFSEWRNSPSAIRPFILLGGGINSEVIGAFNANRFPIGIGMGIRAPFKEKGFFQLEYKYRYILRDPIESFSIQNVGLGIAIYLN